MRSLDDNPILRRKNSSAISAAPDAGMQRHWNIRRLTGQACSSRTRQITCPIGSHVGFSTRRLPASGTPRVPSGGKYNCSGASSGQRTLPAPPVGGAPSARANSASAAGDPVHRASSAASSQTASHAAWAEKAAVHRAEKWGVSGRAVWSGSRPGSAREISCRRTPWHRASDGARRHRGRLPPHRPA